MNMNAEQISNQLAGNKSGIAELRSRLFFVMFALLVYRIGTHIPVPGIDPSQLQALFNQNQGGILELFNMFSGGAWERMSILALGVIPYITASIIMNLLTMMYPTFMQWKKEGDAGRRNYSGDQIFDVGDCSDSVLFSNCYSRKSRFGISTGPLLLFCFCCDVGNWINIYDVVRRTDYRAGRG